jgi:N-methylhydantoinase B
LDYTEQRTRGRIEELGNGTAAGEAVIDDDGVRVDVPLTVRARITIDGNAMTIDFTGTDPQATGPINAPEGPAISAALYGAMILLDDPEIPINEGMFAALEIIRPEGSLVAPRRPGAANARGITMLAMIDAMIDAMAKLHPSRAIAGCDLNHVMTLSSADETGRTRSFHDRDYGGTGARYGQRGVDAHGYAVFAGRSNVVPVEIVEREHAVLFERHALRRGSEGPGRWPGGRGVVKQFRVLRESNLTVRTDKFKFPPRGIAGGGDGVPGAWILNIGTDAERHLRSKETNLTLTAGETLTMLTPGGGGFGEPETSGHGPGEANT